MSAAFQFPLISSPQQLRVTLNNTLYSLRVYWNANSASNCWVLDIYDLNGNTLVAGVPLVTGTDLMAQFPYLNFGGEFIVQTSSNTDAVPTFTNLGNDGNLFFVTP